MILRPISHTLSGVSEYSTTPPLQAKRGDFMRMYLGVPRSGKSLNMKVNLLSWIQRKSSRMKPDFWGKPRVPNVRIYDRTGEYVGLEVCGYRFEDVKTASKEHPLLICRDAFEFIDSVKKGEMLVIEEMRTIPKSLYQDFSLLGVERAHNGWKIIGATQRPVSVPTDLYALASELFSFQIIRRQDRKQLLDELANRQIIKNFQDEGYIKVLENTLLTLRPLEAIQLK